MRSSGVPGVRLSASPRDPVYRLAPAQGSTRSGRNGGCSTNFDDQNAPRRGGSWCHDEADLGVWLQNLEQGDRGRTRMMAGWCRCVRWFATGESCRTPVRPLGLLDGRDPLTLRHPNRRAKNRIVTGGRLRPGRSDFAGNGHSPGSTPYRAPRWREPWRMAGDLDQATGVRPASTVVRPVWPNSARPPNRPAARLVVPRGGVVPEPSATRVVVTGRGRAAAQVWPGGIGKG